jgi:hypothetical protein
VCQYNNRNLNGLRIFVSTLILCGLRLNGYHCRYPFLLSQVHRRFLGRYYPQWLVMFGCPSAQLVRHDPVSDVDACIDFARIACGVTQRIVACDRSTSRIAAPPVNMRASPPTV